jgi:hypothetical protein
MKDKSQKDDMRAALQGDLARARERRGSTLLDREPEVEIPGQVSDTPAEASDVPVPMSDTPEPEPAQVSDTPAEASDVPVPVSDTTEPKRRFLWFLR